MESPREDTVLPAEQYVLSTEQNRRIFEQEIVPAELDYLEAEGGGAEATEQASRVAVFLVGQTGAGKTRTAPLLTQAMPPRHAHLIADTYKTYHPAYADLVARSPALASPATGPDARRWLYMACRLASTRGADCLVESACRHPDDLQDLVRLFRDRGYTVRVALLAVPEALSRLGILVRYHHGLPEARSGKLPLRLTPRPVHDATFAGLLDAASWLDRETPADDVVVLRRGGLLAYGYCRNHPADQSAVAPSLLRERRRPLTPPELQLANDELRQLRRLGQGQLEAQLRGIDALLCELTQPVPRTFPEVEPFDHAAFVRHGLGA